MPAQELSGTALAAVRRPGPRDPEELLLELEERHSRLCSELAEVEKELRRLRTAADVCPLCGGSGERWLRGGLYGELQRHPCSCTEPEPADAGPQ